MRRPTGEPPHVFGRVAAGEPLREIALSFNVDHEIRPQVPEPISGSAGDTMDAAEHACEDPASQQRERIAYCVRNNRRFR
jgi:hypothetical protein